MVCELPSTKRPKALIVETTIVSLERFRSLAIGIGHRPHINLLVGGTQESTPQIAGLDRRYVALSGLEAEGKLTTLPVTQLAKVY